MIRPPSRLSRLFRWRTLRWAVAAPALPFALWACTAHPLEQPFPAPEAENAQYFDVNPVRDIDILFMIDDSPSMADKQANLRKNFPAFIQALQDIPGGLPSVHIGVVTSDLGSGPTAVNGNQCVPGGKRGILRTGDNCGLNGTDRFIVAGQGIAPNFAGDISTVFSCMANAGDQGCGFEHQLQAVRVALYENVTPQNAGFLRADAYLGIILLTDEDDCSADPTSDLFTDDKDFPGTTPSFRCAQVGHLCDGKMPPIAPYTTDLSNCVSNDHGRLIAVPDIVNSIRALKPRPNDQILVSAITGWSFETTPPPQYVYGNELNPDKSVASMNLDYQPICYGIGTDGQPISATAALRVKEFVDSFGDNGSFDVGNSICTNDFSPAMKVIAEKLAAKVSNSCITTPVMGGKAGTPECVVTDNVPAAGGGTTQTSLQMCNTGMTNTPCWKLDIDPGCPASNFRIDIQRGNTAVVAGTEESIRCATCTDPADARCALPM